MNKEIYEALCAELGSCGAGLRHIDWDNGQLESASERPALEYPSCLVDINYADCRDLTDREQLVRANIVLKVVCRPLGETKVLPGVVRSPAPVADRARALGHFELLESVHRRLQGNTLGGRVSAISRRAAVKNVRGDRLVVYTLHYDTTFQELAEGEPGKNNGESIAV